MEQDEVARRARAAGLTRYLETEPDKLAALFRAADSLARRLPTTLKPSEEPAHVLRLTAPEGRS